MVRRLRDPFPGSSRQTDLSEAVDRHVRDRDTELERDRRRQRKKAALAAHTPIPGEREIMKQVSFYLSLSDWRLLRAAAGRDNQPITELCRQEIEPLLARLRAAG